MSFQIFLSVGHLQILTPYKLYTKKILATFIYRSCKTWSYIYDALIVTVQCAEVTFTVYFCFIERIFWNGSKNLHRVIKQLLTDNASKKITQDVLVRCSVITSNDRTGNWPAIFKIWLDKVWLLFPTRWTFPQIVKKIEGSCGCNEQ